MIELLIGTLISIIGFFAVLYIKKLIKIEENLQINQVQLVKIREKMLSREQVKQMIIDQVSKYHRGGRK